MMAGRLIVCCGVVILLCSKHRNDAARNGAQYDIITRAGFRPVESGSLSVGDIVRVKENQMIPADLVFLGSASALGDCHIDKSNLNGETNWENYGSVPETRPFCVTEHDLAYDLVADITVDAPNKYFDSFSGSISVTPHSESMPKVKGTDTTIDIPPHVDFLLTALT